MENQTYRPATRRLKQSQTPSGFNLSAMLPWIGGMFWVALYLFVMLEPLDPMPELIETFEERNTPTIQLQGLKIRQETPYTNQKYTYTELRADHGWTLEGGSDSHLLTGVTVKLVTRDQSQDDQAGLDSLSDELDVSWVLIQAATGTYSITNRDIMLEGAVEVFGYDSNGQISEWVKTEKMFYDWRAAQIRSLAPAYYEGQSLFPGQPCRGYFQAGLDLTAITIDQLETLDPEEHATPVRFPEQGPVYDPPEALKFLKQNQPVG